MQTNTQRGPRPSLLSVALAASGITGTALARAAAVHPSTVSRWLSGHHRPRSQAEKRLRAIIPDVDSLLSARLDGIPALDLHGKTS